MRLKLKTLLAHALLDNPISKLIKENKFSYYKLNLSEISPDPRDWKHIKRKTGNADITSPSFSRRNFSPPVKDQGSIGSCVGHSGRIVLGSSKLFQEEEPSPMWIYKRGKRHDAWAGEDYSGTSIKGAAMATKIEGCCFESFWPYVASENTEPLDGATEDAEKKRIHSFYVIPCEDTDEIKSMLLDRPLWYGFMVYDNFFSISSNGIVDTEKYLSSNKAGGHAVCMIGWRTINNKLYWEFQNSWGKMHGNFGYFFLEDSLFKKIIINSIGPYYVEVSDGFINPDPEPVDPNPDPEPMGPEPDPEPVEPDPDPEPVDPDPVDPKPDPEPVEPDPEPDPEPVEPDPKKPWFTKKIKRIALGVIFAIILAVFGLKSCSTSDDVKIPNPPYINENGDVDWDKKFEQEIKDRNLKK